jgi:hypothetical protein
MICRPCATGVDLATLYRTDTPESQRIGVRHAQAQATIREAHKQCDGCDCQHKINLDEK